MVYGNDGRPSNSGKPPPNMDLISNYGPSGTIDNQGASEVLHYKSQQLATDILLNFAAFRENKHLCDVLIYCLPTEDPGHPDTIETSTGTAFPPDISHTTSTPPILAHRLLLAACTPYFKAMFHGNMTERNQSKITIHGVNPEALKLLIDFCYTAEISIDESNVQQLLPAASHLEMTEVLDQCCTFLERQLDPSNCLGIRAFADTHSCQDLLRAANSYAQEKFLEVRTNEEFLHLPLEQLVEIIQSDELNVGKEEDVYRAVMDWVRKESVPPPHMAGPAARDNNSVSESRKSQLFQILQHVRFPLMAPKFLVGECSQEPLIRADVQCRDLIDEAKNFLLLPQERLHMQSARTRPRKITRCGEILYAVGGWCSGEAIFSVERYDPQANEWRVVAGMSKRRCGVGVAVMNECLYAVGGHDGSSYLNSVERYDPKPNTWSCDVATVNSSRTSVGVAVLDGCLYAVGGQDGMACLNVVEKYDVKSNRWTKVASMNTRRLGVGVAVLEGMLYAIGGSDGTCPLSSVERYDPNTNKWSFVSSMNTKRKHLGVAVHQYNIFVVGGRDELQEVSTVERYNPACDMWTSVAPMTTKRSGVALAVVNNKLVAIGGFDGNYYLKSVEVYDETTDSWKPHSSMNHRRLGGGVGVIRLPHEVL